jgi:hypothetical protein
MNERIKELALQSGAVPLVGHGGLIISNLNVEKFAELIVEECVGIIEGDKRIDWGDSAELINSIKDNFGVEE